MAISLYRRTVGEQRIYYARLLINGRITPRSTGCTDKTLAMARAEEMQAEQKRLEGEGQSGYLDHEEAFDRYLKWAITEKRQSTLDLEILFWGMFWKWSGHQNVYDVTVEEVGAFKTYLSTLKSKMGKPYSPHTINDILRAITTVYSHLRRIRIYTGDNPFKSTASGRVRAPKKRPDFLSGEELTKLLGLAEKMGRDIHIFVALGALAGLRKREILNLRWIDIDFARQDRTGVKVGCISVWEDETHTLKTESANRIVPIHANLLPILKGYRPQRDCRYEYLVKPSKVLPGSTGYRWDPRKALNTLGKGIERKVHPHLLRHTFASLLVQAGVSLKKISGWLGHSSITTTEIYAHLSPVDNDISLLG